MIFNGHTSESIDAIDEETLAEIIVMYADGVLGQRSVFDALAPVTAGVFNFMRDSSTAPFNSDKIFPWIKEYLINPDIEPEHKVSDTLLAFMSAAPGF